MVLDPKGARKRLLLLTPRWPYPINGGDRLRIWQLAREVARKHDITLISLCQTQAEMQSEPPDDGVFVSIHRVLLPRWRSWLQMVIELFGVRPLQVAYYDCPSFTALVSRLGADHDLVWCHLLRVTPPALSLPLPCWVEMTDAISLTMERAAQTHAKFSVGRWLFRLEAIRMRHFERQIVNRCELVTFISEADRAAVVSVPDDKPPVVVAPNGVEAPSTSVVDAGLRPQRVALLGRMDSLANLDALHWFVAHVWPQVLMTIPSAQLHIIGHIPTRELKRLTRAHGVVVEGVMPDLSTVLASCRVGVCPVRIGAGIQNKLLDYMAHGLAAVTSQVGLEGLGATPGVHLTVASSAGEWTSAIVRLLTDASAATSIARAGRDLVLTHHRWPDSLAPAIRALDELLEHSSTPTSAP